MKEIRAKKYTFHAVVKGDPGHIPVIMLHGFPETSYMWRDLQKELVLEGFFTIAPDQRGYSPGARPSGKKNYSIELLSRDIIDIADVMKIDRFHLIGHDWGSAVGWDLVSRYPERVISWTAMSVPHLAALSNAIVNNDEQIRASRYMRQFQWPVIHELILKTGDYKNLKSIWDQSSPDEVKAYLQVLSQHGALTAAINWYRANYKSLGQTDKFRNRVSTPTLFIWGRNDPAILQNAASGNKSYIDGEYREVFLDSGHWLLQESYVEVSRAIVEMLNVYK